MVRKDREVLLKIEKHISHAIKYSEKYDNMAEFEQDEMCVEATVFNLMQIGELSKYSLSDEYKESIHNIPWKQMYGMRNRIVHGYEGVDLKIVWDTIKDDLPELRKEILKLLLKSCESVFVIYKNLDNFDNCVLFYTSAFSA